MHKLNYKDADGNEWTELVSRSYNDLEERRKFFKNLGAKTWINLYDHVNSMWMLTVLHQKAA